MMKRRYSVCVLWLATLGVVSSASRIFDYSVLPLEKLEVDAGQNFTIPCPGITVQSLVTVLEWYCKGCEPGQSFGSVNPIVSTLGTDHKLVDFVRDDAFSVFYNQDRLKVASSGFALQFVPVKSSDGGDYACLVNNRPRPEAIIRLVVKDVPDPPGRPLIQSFTSRTVNLSWAPGLHTHNSPITHYAIYTREGEDGEWSEKVLTTDNNGTSYQVSGLLPYTVYSFHVVGVNSRGPSLPSLASYYMVTLREVPDGKPVITSAYNVSSTSIQLAWRAPAKNTLHGEFLGYRLAYRARDGDTDSVEEIYIRDPSIEFYTIQDLEVFKEYIITLQVFNPEGLGPPVTTMVFTDEGEPTAPRNVSILDVTNTTVKLKWEEPEFPNGLIAGYHVYYYQVDKSDTQVKIFKSSEKVQIQEVDNLESNTEYKLWVKAFTSENDGEPSEHHFVKTDVGIPSAPKIANLTCYSDTVLFIQWLRPVYFSNSIDYYYIEYRNEKDWDFEVQEVASTNNRNDYMMLIPNLTSDAMYEIRIRAGTRSMNNPQFVHLGNYSEARKVLVQHDCGRPMSFKDSIANFLERGEITSGMVAGMACAVFALVLVILAFVLWRKYFQAAYYYLDDAPPPTPPNGVGVAWDGGSAVIKAESEDGDPPEEKGPIPVPLFPKHVIALHADGDIGFSKEYEAVQSGNLSTKSTTDHSMHPDNKGKNRYHNIVAYDQTRVILKLPPGQKKSCDYINANFIDGFQKSRAYIGTQGPLPTTFDAYWRMIWEQKVVIIVMITNLIERGRVLFL